MNTLKDKTLFITGGSRGIGREIALRAARDGARIAIAAKTVEPNPKLAGTIHSVAGEIEKAGGKALSMQPKWFAGHVAYTMSKYGMSMCTLGMAEELRGQRIAVNSLWPRTTIATAAVEVHFPAAILRASRHAAIMADAAHVILTSDSRTHTGNFYIDEEVLEGAG